MRAPSVRRGPSGAAAAGSGPRPAAWHPSGPPSSIRRHGDHPDRAAMLPEAARQRARVLVGAGAGAAAGLAAADQVRAEAVDQPHDRLPLAL